MTQADRVHSTPPTNTSANNQPVPVDPTRRRFLSHAAGVAAAGGTALALATIQPAAALATPAIPLDPSHASPALRDATRALDAASEVWKAAKADFVAEDLKAHGWQDANPEPKGRRAKKRHWARWRKERDRTAIHAVWQAQRSAEDDFNAALVVVARIAPRDMAELALKACIASVYEDGEFFELLCGNSSPIARSVAGSLIQLSKAVTS
jgi:hypothetical protein